MLRYLPLLLLPAAAFAQTPEVVAKVDAKLDAERTAQRSEDVEVLRRLLNKACGLPDKARVTVEPAARANPNDPAPPFSMMTPEYQAEWNKRMAEWDARNPLKPGATKTSAAVGPFDGVYLPGAGAVFTLHVPAGAGTVLDAGGRVGLSTSCGACHAGIPVNDTRHLTVSTTACTTCHDAEVKPAKELSDWDRTKADVRGEKPRTADPKPKEAKPRAAVCEPGSLSAQISGVLATNARHLRHLDAKERITVVVTFDEPPGTAKPTVWNTDGGLAGELEAFEVVYNPLRGQTEPKTLPGKPGFTPDEVKSLTLGDLHLKAGKYKDAADAYAAALARYTEKEFKTTAPANLSAEQRRQYADELQKGVRDAYKGYTRALVMLDQTERAKAALDLATGFVVLEVTPTTVPASATGPAKLLVTLSKAELEKAVAFGEVQGSADKVPAAVTKAIKVERVNFPK